MAASKERAPAATPIIVADMPRLTRHQRGTINWTIGRIPMLINAVAYAVNSARKDKLGLSDVYSDFTLCSLRLLEIYL